MRPGTSVGVDELMAFLAARVPRRWVPDAWVLLDEIPKTSVGKFDKKALRASHGST
jgi:fatty-acyl-CoA synthase